MSRQINPFEDNAFLEIARILHEDAYARDRKEVAFGNVKFDIIRRREDRILVCEIKKSSKFLKSAEMQLGFYLLQLARRGLKATGEILVPKEKKKISVVLNADRKKKIESAVREIEKIIKQKTPPEPVKGKYCPPCAYADFCWS